MSMKVLLNKRGFSWLARLSKTVSFVEFLIK